MLVKACRQDTEINRWKLWRLLPETVTITSYPTSDKSHDGSDHSAQGNASQMPKRIRDITKMRATQHRIIGNAILPGTNKAFTNSFQLNA
jgi:hypothetical protein